jgi:hypothetical protein
MKLLFAGVLENEDEDARGSELDDEALFEKTLGQVMVG